MRAGAVRAAQLPRALGLVPEPHTEQADILALVLKVRG